jgi:pyruvate formate lyase activating enzyme
MRDHTIIVAGWTKYSFIDYPGKVATLLFFSGCNLRCPYCHNPSLVDEGGTVTALSTEQLSLFLDKRDIIIEGAVLTGGEPTLHPRLGPLISSLRSRKLAVKLDTNGLLPETISTFAPDYLALDVKTLPSLYGSLLKAPFDNVAQRLAASIDIVRSMGDNAEIRITVAPEIINEKIIVEIGRMIMGVKKVFLQPMQQGVPLLNSAWEKKRPIGMDEINRYQQILASSVGVCRIRGEDDKR